MGPERARALKEREMGVHIMITAEECVLLRYGEAYLEYSVLGGVFDSGVAAACLSGESAQIGLQRRHEGHLLLRRPAPPQAQQGSDGGTRG